MQRKVLIVDDVELNREVLGDILEDTYDLLFAENGKVAIDLINKNKKDLSIILLDLFMPEIDGFGVLKEMDRQGLTERIPVIVITSDQNYESVKKCSEYKVVDFVRKPFDGSLVNLRVGNAVELYSYKNRLEDKVKEQTEELLKQNKHLLTMNEKTINLLGNVVEYRDAESGDHIKRIQEYTRIFAKQIMQDCPEYELTENAINTMVQASLLHDVGKVAVPDSILLKNGRLTDEEFAIIKNHTIDGSEIIDSMKDAWDYDFYKMSYDICRYHHERYDGRGYPDKLKGDDIPISAQIVAIADVYDALVSKRPYKEPYSCEKAFEMILAGDCGTFSSKLLNSFKKVKVDFASYADAKQQT